jgi:hypothetical protein
MNLSLLLFAVCISVSVSAVTGEDDAHYDYSAMANVEIDSNDVKELAEDPAKKLRELNRLGRSCEVPGATLAEAFGGKVTRSRTRSALFDKEDLNRNALMRDMNQFFGTIKTYDENDPNNPTRALDNMMRKVLGNLDPDERAFFKAMAAATIAAFVMLAVWLCGCCCIFWCGYDTVMDTYVPCCRGLVKGCCWPAICCCEGLWACARCTWRASARCFARWCRCCLFCRKTRAAAISESVVKKVHAARLEEALRQIKERKR